MSEPYRASLIVWEWTCDGEDDQQQLCGLTAMGTFDEFAATGWVERANMVTGKVEKFCPRCTRGWKFVGQIVATEERRAEETNREAGNDQCESEGRNGGI
jgi:hypothetical protein